jgi:hypothetical protein
VKVSEVLDDATRRLEASPAIDHWQKDRERIEAEDLLVTPTPTILTTPT